MKHRLRRPRRGVIGMDSAMIVERQVPTIATTTVDFG